MNSHKFKTGDWVVYRKQKVSDTPGPRARHTSAAAKGDYYNYIVDKYWVVLNLVEKDKLELVTRRGKHHIVEHDDPRLRKANWWERLMYSARFRAVSTSLASGDIRN